MADIRRRCDACPRRHGFATKLMDCRASPDHLYCPSMACMLLAAENGTGAASAGGGKRKASARKENVDKKSKVGRDGEATAAATMCDKGPEAMVVEPEPTQREQKGKHDTAALLSATNEGNAVGSGRQVCPNLRFLTRTV